MAASIPLASTAAPVAPAYTIVVDKQGDQIQTLFLSFLTSYRDSPDADGGDNQRSTYELQLEHMFTSDGSMLKVNFHHVWAYSHDLARNIQDEYYRFEPFLRRAVQNFYKQLYPEPQGAAVRQKDFFLSFYNLEQVDKKNIQKLRDLRTDSIGKLSVFTGTVTRTSEVRPELLLAKYRCLNCATETDYIEQQFKYTEPAACPNAGCENRSNWQLLLESCKFTDYQRIKVQENSSEIPSGSMPRTIDVILRSECVERAKAGDKMVFTGTVVVTPDLSQLTSPGESASLDRRSKNRSNSSYVPNEGMTGLRKLGVRDLTYKMCFVASSVLSQDAKFGNHILLGATSDDDHSAYAASDSERAQFEEMSRDRRIFSRLAGSIAPNIWGHDDIKKGILLMLLGGVHKKTREGLALRGDINVCIVGDPSTAKSQFLKYVTTLVPRAVYTSGKSSSAAGLTASVIKDAETGEFGIEAGALMLADNGICCIDEFDKMDDLDQTAIHEAMEQQTISIAKAGIRATLNARASILAAANPISGRYDDTKPLRQNLSMTSPIMSRFDLFFLCLDKRDDFRDNAIARHVVQMHRNKGTPVHVDYSKDLVKNYIRYARTIEPQLSLEALKESGLIYLKLRQNDMSKMSIRITVRQLEAVIRLSEAIARLHLSPIVTRDHILEATEIVRRSITPIASKDIDLGQEPAEDEDGDDGGDDNNGHDDDGADQPPKLSNSSAPQQQEDVEMAPVSSVEALPEKPSAASSASVPSITGSSSTASNTRKPTQITAQKFDMIEKQLLMHLSQSKQNGGQGVPQADLEKWYLDQIEARDEELLKAEARIVRLVIKKLVEQMNKIFVLSDSDVSRDERLLTIHPNLNVLDYV